MVAAVTAAAAEPAFQAPPVPDALPAQSAAVNNLAFIGHIGGAPEAVDAQGSYVYYGEGPRLTIFDVSDKSNPLLVGQTAPLAGSILDITVSGSFAYVAAHYQGLHIFNIADPTNPQEIGAFKTPGYANSVAVAAGLAYIADGGYGLRVIDISNPAAPFEVGFNNPGLWLSDVAVTGNTVYTTSDYGLIIFDVSSPSSPVMVGYYLTGLEAGSVAAYGDYALFVVGDSVIIVDASNPTAPVKKAAFKLPDYGGSGDLVVAGTHAFVISASRLIIIDLANPAAPTEKGSLNTPDLLSALAVDGSHAYMTGLTGGLYVINVANISSPAQSSFFDLLGYAEDIALKDGYAYIASGWDGLDVVDISTPAAPVLAGHENTPVFARSVAVMDSRAYIADSWGGLRIFDISSPAAPHEVGFFETPGGSYHDVALSGSFAYIADNSGLYIIDVSDPSAPSQTGFVPTPDGANGVTLAGNYAYVAAGTSGLRIIDISNPSAPAEGGFFDTPGNAQDVILSGKYAYIADEGKGVRIADISNPAAPTAAGAYDTDGQANGLAIAGKHLYIADGGRLLVLNISNPAVPTAAGFYKTAGAASQLALSGSTVLVADGSGGLLLVKNSAPGSITIKKQAEINDGTKFAFNGDLGAFALKSGQSKLFPALPANGYQISEAPPVGWTLAEVICDGGSVSQTAKGVTVHLQPAEDITCTFKNRRLSVTADAGGPYAGDEGSAIALDASDSSNLALISLFKWDCTNDGTWDIVARDATGDACTYADNGSYTIKLRTWDVFGRTSTDTAAVSAANVAPDVAAGADQTAVSGHSVQFNGAFTDPGTADTHTIKWDFGDGAKKWNSLTPRHIYTTAGDYTVTLTVTDDDGASGSDQLTVNVAGPAPSMSDIIVSPTEIDEAQSITLSGNMAAGADDGPMTLLITWGDGSATTDECPPGSSSFVLAHTYLDDDPSGTPVDTVTIDLHLSDASGAFTNTTAVLKVNNVAPTVDAGPDRQLVRGESADFAAKITDPGPLDTHTITWDFGDGSPAEAGADVTHSYAEPGSYAITVTVTDDDGGSGSDTILLQVLEMAHIYLPVIGRR